MATPLNKVRVNVPGMTTFDKSFKNILTGKVGHLIPIVSKYVMPGAKGKLSIALSAMLPPLASDCFMRADLKVEAFLVPMRLLYGGFESWLTGKKYHDGSSSWKTAELPVLQVGNSQYSSYAADLALMGPGSLADYLGMRMDASQTFPAAASNFNIFPFLAYHRVYDDWYRNPLIQNPLFYPIIDGASPTIDNIPYWSYSTLTPFYPTTTFIGGTRIVSLQRRNYGEDYFSVCRPSAQQGNGQSVSVSGSFTIQSLRQANSIQQWAERSNFGSSRLQDYVRAHFGADLSSGVAQRAILLGSASYPVYSKGIEANAGVTATNNPFTSVGAQYGRGMAAGSDFVCRFECNEPSYLMVMCSLVPEANYGSGIEHEFYLLNAAGAQVDLPDPLLENTGNEPVYSTELTGLVAGGSSPGNIFGYLPKNSWYKCGKNTVHGLLRAGQSLDSFVAQRVFSGTPPTISSSFTRIDSSALDNVTAVTADLSNYGFWLDSHIGLFVSEPLVQSAMPSLQDPAYEHGRSVVLNQKTDL